MEQMAHGHTFGTYWMQNKEWYTINKELDRFELTEKATDKARRSFEVYKKDNNLNY